MCQRGRDPPLPPDERIPDPVGSIAGEQRAETVLAKSESERNAGAVFGQLAKPRDWRRTVKVSAEKEEEGRREITRRERERL